MKNQLTEQAPTMDLNNVFAQYQKLTSELKEVTETFSEELYKRFETYQQEVSDLGRELFYPNIMDSIEREGGSGMWYSCADYIPSNEL